MMKPLATVFLGFAAYLIAGQAQEWKRRPVVYQLDHILVQTGDPRSLFDFFTDTLKLPVAWPLREYTGFTSGGVGLGEVNIEVFRYENRRRSQAPQLKEAHIMGLAFQPYPLKECLAGLQARGISYNPPEPYVSTLPDGTRGPMWTTVVLPRLSRPGLSVFLCEYSPKFLNVEVRRKQIIGQLVLSNGGPLQIQSIREIVIGTQDQTKDRQLWQSLLAPCKFSSTGSLQAARGPAIRLVAGTADRIERIVFKVKSLEHAKAFLEEKRMLGPASSKEITIRPRAAQGLLICLQ